MTSGSEIGERIHQRRGELGLSLRELARRSGLSASFISQVERGKVNVSVDSLQRLAESLNIPILYFLQKDGLKAAFTGPDGSKTPLEPTSHDSPYEYTPVVDIANRPRLTLPASGIAYELLTNDLNRKMEAIYERLQPGAAKLARPLREPTEEFIYLLSGSLSVSLETGEHILHPGDTIYFEGRTLQRLACASQSEDAVWIAVITPPVL